MNRFATSQLQRIFLSFLLLTLVVTGKAQDIPHPAARAIALKGSELPPGYEYLGERDLCLQAGSQSNYLALMQMYEVDSPRGQLGVTFVYAALESKQNAATAFRSYPASIKNHRPDELVVGDRTWGNYPNLTCILQDRAVVTISINPRVGYNDEGLDKEGYEAEIAPYADALSDAVVQKLDSMGYLRSAPFELSLSVVSDLVSPNSRVEVSLRGRDSSIYPLKFYGQVRAQDTTIAFEFERSSSDSGEFVYSWDGRNAVGQPMPAGKYSLEIGAHDVLGRLSVVEIIPVTVADLHTEPTTETLPATKDAIIDTFDPNGNEGANGILALDKLLGRSSRSLVGFDLSEVDTENLSKATLVLSIHKEERIFGCGPGESVAVQALTAPWVEGNGKTYKVLKLSERRRGSGSGATWQRDTDSNISNFVANGGSVWSGAASKVLPPTAPLVTARDDMNGTLQFDVTDDVINGAGHGWLVRKQHESRASRISFYSKEGASAKGDPNLAPRLILEYGGPVADTADRRLLAAASRYLGFGSAKLRPAESAAEAPGLREYLQHRPTAAYLGEQLLLASLVGEQPALDLGARLLYRSWLKGEFRVV